MGERIYLDVISLMNNKTYKVTKVPLSYATAYNNVVKDGLGNIVDPCYDPDENETTSWRMSIVGLVDLFFNKVPFRFSSIEDIEDICRHMATYVNWINSLRSVPPDHKVFASRAKPFLDHIYHKCNVIRHGKKLQGLVKPTFAEVLFNTR
jgi:hypothetical protein